MIGVKFVGKWEDLGLKVVVGFLVIGYWYIFLLLKRLVMDVCMVVRVRGGVYDGVLYVCSFV